MTAFSHTPVLLAEAMTYLDPRPGGVYWDGTLGRGGHSRGILERSSPDGRLIAVDRDPEALAAAAASLAEFGDRVTFVHGEFGDIAAILGNLGITQVTGMLLDIGPSSPQFDQPERGFSFMHEGPLDMRMNQSQGETARDLLRRLSSDEIAAILRDFGEEKYAKRIAARIKEEIRRGDLGTTTELAALVAAAIPEREKRQMKIHPATRTFQALRIAVNDELAQLSAFLADFPAHLAQGGRCVVICFHSLEDRLVKRCFRELHETSSLPRHLALQAGERVDPICIPLTRKPVFATEAEVAANPRARSARLRACEKVAP